MSAETFLSLVEHRQTGKDCGVFRVPTRKDRNMSGSYKIASDGRLLIHDHGGDSALEILNALGLSFSDLFPEKLTHHGKPERRPFPAADVLRAIGYESLVVCAAAASLMSGEPFTQVDRDRLMLAAERIQAAMTAAGVQRG